MHREPGPIRPRPSSADPPLAQRVAAIKVGVELEAAELFEHGHAHFFGSAGVDGGFVNDDIAHLSKEVQVLELVFAVLVAVRESR